MNGIYDILSSIRSNGRDGAYADKMIHKIPEMEIVNRREFIVKRCAGKIVLDIGCASGSLHKEIATVAEQTFGVDKERGPLPTDIQMDLDDVSKPHLPFADIGVNTVVAGEVIEHLSNPGHLLDRILHFFPSCELIVTVPNCFSIAGFNQLQKNIECVSKHHVAWYSWKTLSMLLSRHGWDAKERYWYNGKPVWAEGLVFVCKAVHAETPG